MYRPSQTWHHASSSLSNSRSSRADPNYDGARHTKEGLGNFSTQSSTAGHATAIDIFVAALHEAGLPGPVVLIDETAEGAMIGRGSQFVVYKQKMAMPEFTQFSTRPVAVKVPRFPLDPKTPLKLVGSAAQKHLHDMYLEVLALTNPTIRSHPHVARLLAWSHGIDTMNSPLTLVMELAHCSLRSFLQNQSDEQVDMPLKYQFCRNIAAGVDVLHECGFIHGDLKPDNILIFKNRKGDYVAKVADFGLSVTEVISDAGVNIVASIGGTYGWQAPEVEQGRNVPRDHWISTDNYSFGLLVWSVVLLDGVVPPRNVGSPQSLTARQHVEAFKRELESDIWQSLAGALDKTLREDPSQRPDYLQPLLSERRVSDQDLYVQQSRLALH